MFRYHAWLTFLDRQIAKDAEGERKEQTMLMPRGCINLHGAASVADSDLAATERANPLGLSRAEYPAAIPKHRQARASLRTANQTSQLEARRRAFHDKLDRMVSQAENVEPTQQSATASTLLHHEQHPYPQIVGLTVPKP